MLNNVKQGGISPFLLAVQISNINAASANGFWYRKSTFL